MRWLALAFVAGCGSDVVDFDPVVDVPANDSASAFPLNTLGVSVAHDGADVDLASATLTHGQPIELAGVPFGDDLVLHMTGRIGTSDVAYGRTCTFVFTADGPPPSPHLFFSRTAMFADLTATPLPRLAGAAIAYHDGSGLLIGGSDPAQPATPVQAIERFDPRTGLLDPALGTLQPRTGGVAAQLGTGIDTRIVVVGGVDPSGAGASFYEIVDADNPADRRIQLVPDANMSRVDLTATTLTDGRVIAIGGIAPGQTMPSSAVDEIKLTNDQAEVHQLHATLATARSRHTATRLGNDVGAPVLVAGGVDATGSPVAPAELFKPLSESFSTTFVALMKIPRSHHQTVRMPDGSALILGGIDVDGNAVPELELFTQDAGFSLIGTKCQAGDTCENSTPCPTTGRDAFVCARMLPPTSGLVDFTATTLPDGRVLITGGSRTLGGPAVSTAVIATLDPINGSVDVVPSIDQLSTPRAGHQATLLCDGTVLISGGTSTQAVLERYNPPATDRR